MKNFLEQFCNNAGLSVMIGVRRFFNPSTGCLEQFCNRKSIDNKMVTGYTEFALRKMRIIKAVYFIIRSPVWSLRPDRRVTGEQSQKQYDNNDPPLKNSERSNFLGD